MDFGENFLIWVHHTKFICATNYTRRADRVAPRIRLLPLLTALSAPPSQSKLIIAFMY